MEEEFIRQKNDIAPSQGLENLYEENNRNTN